VALAVGVVHGGEHIRRPGQLELHDGQCQARMTLEHTGEDQIAHRQCRIERLGRAAAGIAQALSRPAPSDFDDVALEAGGGENLTLLLGGYAKCVERRADVAERDVPFLIGNAQALM
jgi:hypothetical protein